jgi:hypothetical protein
MQDLSDEFNRQVRADTNLGINSKNTTEDVVVQQLLLLATVGFRPLISQGLVYSSTSFLLSMKPNSIFIEFKLTTMLSSKHPIF